MPKKVLIVVSVISFIEWFNKENIEFLRDELGCEVHIACNFDYMDDTDEVRTKKYIDQIKSDGVVLHNIGFARRPFARENLEAYKALRELIAAGMFDLIHCHTPAVSMMTRIAARKMRKKGSVVMYTSHGFHFHRSAPKKNWLLYFPVEKLLSRYCDYLLTINLEDYTCAKTFHCKNVRYIPGVGVNTKRIRDITVDRVKIRDSIGVPEDKILMISAGELIERKNHEVIIRALAKVGNPDIYYVIAGKGPLREFLITLATELGVSERVLFLGFRTDIFELYHASDISAFPSKIEGLGMAGVEAMAAGLPLISSNVHGIMDYAIDGETGYVVDPGNVDGFATAIENLTEDAELRKRMSKNCVKAVEPFELTNALNAMWDIYKEILNESEPNI